MGSFARISLAVFGSLDLGLTAWPPRLVKIASRFDHFCQNTSFVLTQIDLNTLNVVVDYVKI